MAYDAVSLAMDICIEIVIFIMAVAIVKWLLIVRSLKLPEDFIKTRQFNMAVCPRSEEPQTSSGQLNINKSTEQWYNSCKKAQEEGTDCELAGLKIARFMVRRSPQNIIEATYGRENRNHIIITDLLIVVTATFAFFTMVFYGNQMIYQWTGQSLFFNLYKSY